VAATLGRPTSGHCSLQNNGTDRNFLILYNAIAVQGNTDGVLLNHGEVYADSGLIVSIACGITDFVDIEIGYPCTVDDEEGLLFSRAVDSIMRQRKVVHFKNAYLKSVMRSIGKTMHGTTLPSVL
jgi:hypothetical protein